MAKKLDGSDLAPQFLNCSPRKAMGQGHSSDPFNVVAENEFENDVLSASCKYLGVDNAIGSSTNFVRYDWKGFKVEACKEVVYRFLLWLRKSSVANPCSTRRHFLEDAVKVSDEDSFSVPIWLGLTVARYRDCWSVITRAPRPRVESPIRTGPDVWWCDQQSQDFKLAISSRYYPANASKQTQRSRIGSNLRILRRTLNLASYHARSIREYFNGRLGGWAEAFLFKSGLLNAGWEIKITYWGQLALHLRTVQYPWHVFAPKFQFSE